MAKTIKVNFDRLDQDILKMKQIRENLKKPKVPAKMSLVKADKGSQGDVVDKINHFSSLTIEYYQAVDLLLNNTIHYLENARKQLRLADNKSAKLV